jgi:hypothetical protein
MPACTIHSGKVVRPEGQFFLGMATSVRGAAVLAAAAKWYERVRTWIVVVGEWGHIGI